MKNFYIILILVIYSVPVKAWDGYDWDKGVYIEIEEGELVRDGETIDFYDYSSGYRTLDIDSIEEHGNIVEIEGTDQETGETRIFEMD